MDLSIEPAAWLSVLSVCKQVPCKLPEKKLSSYCIFLAFSDGE